MTKNEYRRSLILLRSTESGYSGHVRMERRVTAGNMAFVLQTPQSNDALRAALIGRDKRGYYACAIGEIRQNARGQGALTYTFDPRNICGRELDMYRLIAVVRTGKDACTLVLLGNLNGYADMDLQSAADAVCNLYAPGSAVTPVPDIPIAPLPEAENASDLENTDTNDAPEEIDSGFSVPEETGEDGAGISALDTTDSALYALGLAENAPWPALLEGARQYFQDQSPAEDVPDGEYIYVRVPVEGLDAHLLIGAQTEDGRITKIAYALPADYTEDAPEGLSDYQWQGDDRTGWWVLRIDAE